MSDFETSTILSQQISNVLVRGDKFGISGRYEVKYSTDNNNLPESGYYGAIILDKQTNTNYLVNRGAELDTNADVIAVTDIVFGGVGFSQFDDANQLLVSYEQSHGSDTDYIPVTNTTGHGMGGYLAQVVGVANNFYVDSFGSPGAMAALNNIESAGFGTQVASYDYAGKMNNIVAQNDPVGNFPLLQHFPDANLITINLDDQLSTTLEGTLSVIITGASNFLGYADEVGMRFMGPPVGKQLYGPVLNLDKFNTYHNVDNYKDFYSDGGDFKFLSSDFAAFVTNDLGDQIYMYKNVTTFNRLDGTKHIFHLDESGNLNGLIENSNGTQTLIYHDESGAVFKQFDSLDDLSGLESFEQVIAMDMQYLEYFDRQAGALEIIQNNPDVVNSDIFSTYSQDMQDMIITVLAEGQTISDEKALDSDIIQGEFGDDISGGSAGNDSLGFGAEGFNPDLLTYIALNGEKSHQIKALLQLHDLIKTDGVFDSGTGNYQLDGYNIVSVYNAFGGSAVKISANGVDIGYMTLYSEGNFQQRVVETIGSDGRTNSAQISLADGLVNEIYRGEAIEIKYPDDFIFGFTGGFVGDLVGQELANGELAHDIISASVTRTLGQNLGEVLDFLSTGENNLAEAFFDPILGVNGTYAPRPDILDDFLINLRAGIVSAISSKIVDELGDVVGIDGVGSEVLDVAAGTVTKGIVNETFGLLFNDLSGGAYSSLLAGGFDFSASFYDPSLSGGGYPTAPDGTQLSGPPAPNTTVGDFVQAQVFSALASYAGNRLAGELIEPESEAAAIFGSFGSAIGTAIGTGAIASGSTLANLVTFGLAGGPVGVAIAAFVGTVIGTVFGNAFGSQDHPSSWGFVSFNHATGEYYFTGATQNDGGGLGTGTDLATALANGVNDVIATTGGALRSSATVEGLTIGWKEGEFLVIDDNTGSTEYFDNAGEAISFAAFKLLKDFDLVGGPNVVMRAWHNSDATNLQEFKEDIQVAEAFLEYLQNPTGILALMMDQPDSDLAQSWAAILQRAAELELHLPHEKDFDGGWNEIIAEVYGLNVESLASLDETTLTVTDPVTGEETVFHHFIGPGYEIVRIEGTDGNDIINVVVDGPSIAYVDAGAGDDVIEGSDERDIIFGGEGDDTVNGNGGDDWINGGAGNDVLNGNNGLDFIVGGSDDDVLTGGDHKDTIYGGFGNDILSGGLDDDQLYGGDGDDTLHGDTEITTDTLYGGAGNDTLYGYYADVLIGGKGDDHIIMSSTQNGNKGIKIARGDGHDIVEVTSQIGQYIEFDWSIGLNDLWFHSDPQNSDNLIISVLGEDQTITVVDYKNHEVIVDVLGYYFLSLNDLETSNFAPLLSVQPTGQYSAVSEANLASMSDAMLSVWDKFNTNFRFLHELDSGKVYLRKDLQINYSEIDDFLASPNNPEYSSYAPYLSDLQSAYNNNLFMHVGGNTANSITANYAIGGLGNDQLIAPAESNGNTYNMSFYGDAGDDYILGGNRNITGIYTDILVGGTGNDFINANSGNDRIWGGEGDDILHGAGHDDLIFGGVGNDTIFGEYHNDTIHGGDGDDLIYGDHIPGENDSTGHDIVSGDAGDDTIYGSYGEDTLDGGADDDTIYGGDDNDVLIGGTGNDILDGENGDDTVTDDEGDDDLSGGDGNDRLTAGEGNDSLDMGSGDDFASGGEGDDIYTYTSGHDRITEIGTGIDRIVFDAAWSSNDVLIIDNKLTFTNSSTDSITFSNIDLIEFFDFNGNTGLTLADLPFDRDDTFIGTSAVDIFDGNLGSDTVNYSASSSSIYIDFDSSTPAQDGDAEGDSLTSIENIIATQYDDQLRGSSDANNFFGGNGDDTLKGRGGDDVLNGGVGADYLEGNGGADILYGGLGADTMKGSADIDTFLYKSQYEGGDTILDFNAGSEKIDLTEVLDDAIGFDGTNEFSGGFLRVEQNASDVDLYLDMDGSAGSAAEILFVTLIGESVSSINSSVFILPSIGAPIPANTAPTANNDSETTDENVAVNINVLANDNDLDNDNLTVTILTAAAFGSLVVNGDNTVTYTPDTNYTGSDSFTYQIDDGNGGSDSASVSLSVNAVSSNNAPVAQDDVFAGDQDVNITGNLLADNGNGVDSDPDGDTLNVTAETISTTNGSVTILANGDFTYTPNSSYTGGDSFNYTLLDGNGGSDTGAVSLTLNAVSNNDILGTSGNDSITGTSGDDVIRGLAGNDNLYGELGNDTLYGDEGDDTLKGRDGDDILYGGTGADYLEGNGGNDTLNGGAGADNMKGSSGVDTFVFGSVSDATGDSIQDYRPNSGEVIDIADLLVGYDSATDAITDFVQITDNGTDSFLAVDADGGADNFVQLVTILNYTGITDEESLETNGNLITA